MGQFRVATWNLDGYRSGASARLSLQIDSLERLKADVLVLTEVVDTTALSGMNMWWSATGDPPYNPRDRAVGIAARWGGSLVEVSDQRLSVCVALEAAYPLGHVVVYGTIIANGQDGVRSQLATPWERHRKAVHDVVADCQRIRQDPAYRDAHLVLAGDFNTCLDGSRWYGDVKARNELVKGLKAVGLHCHTLEDIRATRGSDRAIVDHVWSSQTLRSSEPPHIWCDRDEPGRLSDHNGVALRLELSAR